MPRLEAHGRVYFRHLLCPHRRADALQEKQALAWKWYVRLIQRGKDPAAFAFALASYAARAVRSGRRVVGQEPGRGVLSPRAQARRGFVVASLPAGDPGCADPLADALRDNTQTSVPDQVQLRLDFPAWRRTRTARDRRLLACMLAGDRTMDLARRFGLSPARVSQLRRDFHEDWRRFCEAPTAAG